MIINSPINRHPRNPPIKSIPTRRTLVLKERPPDSNRNAAESNGVKLLISFDSLPVWFPLEKKNGGNLRRDLDFGAITGLVAGSASSFDEFDEMTGLIT